MERTLIRPPVSAQPKPFVGLETQTPVGMAAQMLHRQLLAFDAGTCPRTPTSTSQSVPSRATE